MYNLVWFNENLQKGQFTAWSKVHDKIQKDTGYLDLSLKAYKIDVAINIQLLHFMHCDVHDQT